MRVKKFNGLRSQVQGKPGEQKVERQISVLLFIQFKWNNLVTKIKMVSEATHRMVMMDFLIARGKVIKDLAHVIMETELKIMLGFYCRLLKRENNSGTIATCKEQRSHWLLGK